jgi:hypothetical protein
MQQIKPSQQELRCSDVRDDNSFETNCGSYRLHKLTPSLLAGFSFGLSVQQPALHAHLFTTPPMSFTATAQRASPPLPSPSKQKILVGAHVGSLVDAQKQYNNIQHLLSYWDVFMADN